MAIAPVLAFSARSLTQRAPLIRFGSNTNATNPLETKFVSPKVLGIPPFFTDYWNQRAIDAENTYKAKDPNYSLIKLSIGGPSEPPPTAFLTALGREAANPNNHTYSDPRGLPELKQAFNGYLQRQFQLSPVDIKANMLILDGSNAGLTYLISQVLNNQNGKGLIYAPEPGYPTYDTSITLGGFKKVPLYLNPENHFMPKLTRDNCPPKNTVAIILNYPNNPTQALASEDYLRSALVLAKTHNILIVSDFAYGTYEKQSDGKTEKPLSVYALAQKMDRNENRTQPGQRYVDNVIEFYTLSKLGFAGDRIGAVIGPQYLIDAMTKYFTAVRATSLPLYIQKAAIPFLNDAAQNGVVNQTINTMNTNYTDRFNTTVEHLGKMGWEVNKESGPYYYWGKIPASEKNDDVTFVQKILDNTGVLLIPGSSFGPAGKGYVRIAMTQDIKKLNDWFDRMKAQGMNYSK